MNYTNFKKSYRNAAIIIVDFQTNQSMIQDVDEREQRCKVKEDVIMSVNKLNVFNVTANWNELDQECAAAELALISESINNK